MAFNLRSAQTLNGSILAGGSRVSVVSLGMGGLLLPQAKAGDSTLELSHCWKLGCAACCLPVSFCFPRLALPFHLWSDSEGYYQSWQKQFHSWCPRPPQVTPVRAPTEIILREDVKFPSRGKAWFYLNPAADRNVSHGVVVKNILTNRSFLIKRLFLKAPQRHFLFFFIFINCL